MRPSDENRRGRTVIAADGQTIGEIAGLYLEKPTMDARTAITADEAKRMVIVMLRDVSRKDFVDAVKKGIMRNSGPGMPTLRARLDLLGKALPALKKGNVLGFTCLPGAGTLVRGQGREMTIPGTDIKLNAEILTYSRNKGAFAGISPDGAVVQADQSGDKAMYGPNVTRQQILNGKVAVPQSARGLLEELARYAHTVRKIKALESDNAGEHALLGKLGQHTEDR